MCAAEMLLVEYFSADEVLAHEKLAVLEAYCSVIVADLQLPLIAVDPWGFASEGDKSDATTDRILSGRQVPWKYEQHVSKLESYLMHARNFIAEAARALAYKSYTSRGPRKRREAARRVFSVQAVAKAREQIGSTLEHCVAMQRAVRGELGRFGNSEDAIILEKEELRTIRKVWELWLALDLPIKAGAPQAARYVENWLDERIAKLRHKLCKHAAVSGVRILLRDAKKPAEEDIWVVVQVAEPQDLTAALQRIKRSISQVLYDQTPIATAYYRRRWNWLHIVPLFNGRTVLHIAFQTHIAGYCLCRTVDFFSDHVDDEVLAGLGVQRWDSEVARQAEVLWKAIQTLRLSLELLIEVDGAPCDHDARAVAEAHRWRWHAEWITELNKAIFAADWLADAAQRERALSHALETGEIGAVFFGIVECLNSLRDLKPTELRALELRDVVVPFAEQVDAIVMQIIINISARDAVPFAEC
jgi:hypothetical protein